MFFVLPASDGHPMPTLRYEALHGAIQDYELLQIAKVRCHSSSQLRFNPSSHPHLTQGQPA